MATMSSMSMPTATSSAAASTSTAMDMSSMNMGGDCKISMLWNWYTIDACFLASSWHITSHGMFAASCIGVALLVVSLEFLRRIGKEYDAFILRQFQQRVTTQAKEIRRLNSSDASFDAPSFVTFRATPLQQCIRASIYAVTFGVAYIIMLLAMYFNGYLIISIIIGAGIGKFFCDWLTHTISVDASAETAKTEGIKEPTVCCG